MDKGESVTKVRVKHGEIRSVEAVTELTVGAALPKGTNEVDLTTRIEKNKLKAPVEKGDVVGVVKVYNGDELVNERNLIAAESVGEGGTLSAIGIPDKAAPFICVLAVVLFIAVLIKYKMKQLDREAARRRREERRREKDV